MNRSVTVETRKAFREIICLSDSNTIYKNLHSKQVVSSELRVTKLTDVIEKQYTNQFGLDVDTNDRVNINSRTCLPQHVADEVLN